MDKKGHGRTNSGEGGKFKKYYGMYNLDLGKEHFFRSQKKFFYVLSFRAFCAPVSDLFSSHKVNYFNPHSPLLACKQKYVPSEFYLRSESR